MNSKINKDRKTTMDDVLEMISGFESGNFSKTLTEPEDPNLKPLVDKLNSAAKILKTQATQSTALDSSFIVDSLGIGIWKWDLITNSLEWDKNMYLLYGCDPKDFNGAYDAWESSLSPETKAKAIQEINIAIDGGKSFDTVFQVVQRNTGKIQEVRTRAFVIRDELGKPLKMWGINIDRTREAELEKEVKIALKSLEETSKFLEQTGEMAKVGGWELDLKTGNVHMTKQTQIIHEIDSNYVPPQYSTGGEWYPPEAWPVVQSAVNEAIEQGKPYDLESPFINAKGRRIWVRVQGYPLKADGKVTAIRGTFQDITEQKKSAE
jgi:PAS domain-containing protein